MAMINLLRAAKRKALRYRQGERPNICVLGIRRGGSTLLADMLAAQPGVWFANEPFAVFKTHMNASARLERWLPELRHSQFFGLTDEQTNKVDRYIELLNQAQIPIGTARHTRPLFVADRVCIKVLNTPFLADRFADQHNMQSVFLTRHPAAQALSILRQKWGYSAEAYFDQPDFLAAYMTGEQITLGQRLLAEGSDWEKAILNWWVENLYPLRHATTLKHVVTYEELTLRTESWVGLLCETLKLEDAQAMIGLAHRPSNSSNMSTGDTVKQIAGGDRMPLVTGWQKKADAEMVARGQDILDAFGVDEYRMDSPMPAGRLLRFEGGETAG